MHVSISSWGATIVSISVPDRKGAVEDVALGFEGHDDWAAKNPSNYMGAAVGRTSNRIGGDKFVLDGVTYNVAHYPPHKNHLHGGPKGFTFYVWQPHLVNGSEIFIADKAVGVRLQHHSPDGDMGYPGNVNVVLTYWLNEDNEFSQNFEATTDKACPIMLTTHSYFNLCGDGKRDITDHEVLVEADVFPEVDAELIPTGMVRSVEGTPMDFRNFHKIGERIRGDYDMLRYGNNGYDLGFTLRNSSAALRRASVARDPESGRVLEVLTDQLVVQFYTGNHLDVVGKKGRHYGRYQGFCFETHGYVNAPNRPEAPQVTLRPGQRFAALTVHRFSTY
jgi:aldose 1-epimerase